MASVTTPTLPPLVPTRQVRTAAAHPAASRKTFAQGRSTSIDVLARRPEVGVCIERGSDCRTLANGSPLQGTTDGVERPPVGFSRSSAAREALAVFRRDVTAEQPLPLNVTGVRYVPQLRQYTGQHLAEVLASFSRRMDEVALLPARPPAPLLSAGEWHEAGQLLDRAADEVRLRLANQHSGRDTFYARDVVAIASAYARLLKLQTADAALLGAGDGGGGERELAAGPSGAVSVMLDSVAGFVVKRIAARHLNAVARPEDVCMLLAAYADLGHRSVAVPDLVAALGEQLRWQVASAYERAAGEWWGMHSVDGGGVGAVAAEGVVVDGGSELDAQAVVLLLEQHAALGLPPASATLDALVVPLWRRLGGCSAPTANRLLLLLAGFRHHPGEWLLSLLAALLSSGVARLPPHDLSRAACAFADLGYAPPPQFCAAAAAAARSAGGDAAAYTARALAAWGALDAAGVREIADAAVRGAAGQGEKEREGLQPAAGSALWEAMAAAAGPQGVDATAGDALEALYGHVARTALDYRRMQVRREASQEPPLFLQDLVRALAGVGVEGAKHQIVAGGTLLLDVQVAAASGRDADTMPSDTRIAAGAAEGALHGASSSPVAQPNGQWGGGTASPSHGTAPQTGRDCAGLVALDSEDWTRNEPRRLCSWAQLRLALLARALPGAALVQANYYDWIVLTGTKEKRAYAVELVSRIRALE